MTTPKERLSMWGVWKQTLAYHHIFCVLIYVYDEECLTWRMTIKIKSWTSKQIL